MKQLTHSPSGQRGAALAVALILLVVVTLLAVAGMRSAGLGFIMAGNEQFRQKAFGASETGIEQAVDFGVFNPALPTQTVAGTVVTTSDTYSARVVPQLGGSALGAIWGNDLTKFSTYHFEVQSTGTSTRNSTALHVQGIAVMAPYSTTFGGAGGP